MTWQIFMEKREGEESRAGGKYPFRRETLLCLFLRAKPLRGKNEIFAPLGAEKETLSVLSFLLLLLLRKGGVRFPHKIASVASCHFPYKYDVIFPTHVKEVFYSPTPIMAVP